jgi:hypothetical protein
MDSEEIVLHSEILLTGRAVTPRPRRRFRAGDLELELDGIDLRRISLNGVEVVQLVYVAVRDLHWNNFPVEVRDLEVDEGPGPRFEVRFTCRHEQAGQGFEWRGRISGSEDGTLEYHLDGTTESGLDYMRLGFCLLHGARTYAGRPFRSWLGQDATVAVLPSRIGPQIFADGRLQGLLDPFDRIELDAVDGVTARFAFEGDEFETEDQRNFGDATFKTYSTPIAKGGPFRLEAGESLSQSVRITASDSRPAAVASPRSAGTTTVHLGKALGRSLPHIGLGAASDRVALSRREHERVAKLQPDHIRIEIVAADGAEAIAADLAAAAAEARALDTDLLVDLTVGASDADGLAAVVEAVCSVTPAPRLLFVASTEMEPPDAGVSGQMLGVTLAIAGAGSRTTLVGVGSGFAFVDLHRWQFEGAAVGSLSYPLSPSIHLADDGSVMENLDRLEDMVVATRDRLGERTLAVGPISLATRHGPYPNGLARPADLPDPVDERQVSLLAAAWTVGCLSQLAYAGVDVLSFFETAGWRGVTERDAGSAMPRHFHSVAASVFPMWHVLADAAEWREAELVGRTLGPEPVFASEVACLVVRGSSGVHLLVASLQRHDRHVSIEGISATRAVVRSLEGSTAASAMVDPESFRASGRERAIVAGRLELDLTAYATVRIDLS